MKRKARRHYIVEFADEHKSLYMNGPGYGDGFTGNRDYAHQFTDQKGADSMVEYFRRTDGRVLLRKAGFSHVSILVVEVWGRYSGTRAAVRECFVRTT